MIVETCFFLDSSAKARLLGWVDQGSLSVIEVPVGAYAELAATIGRYEDHDIDFADAALIWLAEQTGIRRIVTTDYRDFSMFRLKGAKRFSPVEWF